MSLERIIHALRSTSAGNDETNRAISALEAHGFPTRRAERWKYTRSEPFATFAAEALATERTVAVDAASVVATWKARTQCNAHVVFVAGRFEPELSALPDGVELRSLDVAPFVGAAADAGDAMAWLNTAGADGRYQLTVHGRIDETLHCVHVPGGESTLAQTRLHIDVGSGGALHIVEHLIEADSQRHMQSLVTTANVSENGSFDHVRLQHSGSDALLFTRLDIQLGENARSRTLTLDSGAQLVRNELNIHLNAAGAEVHLDGIYLANDRQHIDNHTQVHHAAPDTISRENYRGILRDRSRCVFNGKILVHEGADGTDSAQSNATLLMSDHAEIDTKPELEIYADDVKCAHGATVGQLDETSLFYLRSRGIDEHTATQLLTWAFCREITANLEDDAVRLLADTAIAAEIPDFTALEHLS